MEKSLRVLFLCKKMSGGFIMGAIGSRADPNIIRDKVPFFVLYLLYVLQSIGRSNTCIISLFSPVIFPYIKIICTFVYL